MFEFRKVLLTVVAGCLMIPAHAGATPVFSTNFNGGAPVEFTGVTTTEGVQGFSGFGFSGDFLRNTTTGNPAAVTRLTLNGLAAHTGVDIDFLLAIIDSWDGYNGSPSPDYFNVVVDGTSIFQYAFASASGLSNYTPPAGVLLTSGTGLGFSGWNDAGYNMGNESLFSVAHSASTLTVDFFASGSGWQGSADESWAIDNLSVTLANSPTAVPEPATLALFGIGLAGLARRRFRRQG